MRVSFIMVTLCGSLQSIWGMVPESSPTSNTLKTSSSMVVDNKSLNAPQGGDTFEQSKHSKSPQKIHTGRKKDQKMRIHHKDETNNKKALEAQETPTSVSYIAPHAKDVLNPASVQDYVKEPPKITMEPLEKTLEKNTLRADEKK